MPVSLFGQPLVTVEAWALISPLLPVAATTERPRKWALRRLPEPVLCLPRTGCPRQALPYAWPPHSAVERHFKTSMGNPFRKFAASICALTILIFPVYAFARQNAPPESVQQNVATLSVVEDEFIASIGSLLPDLLATTNSVGNRNMAPSTNNMAPARGPLISAVSSGIPADTYATITWTTDTATNSTVNYGTTAGYGAASSSAAPVLLHSIKITGLNASTTYHFRVQSSNGENEGSSADATFTTTPTLNPRIMLFGDSRTANGNGIGSHVASNTYASRVVAIDGYSACIPFESNNNIYYDVDWNFGVGGQSTAGFLSRHDVASFAASGGNALNYVGSGGKITGADNEFNTSTNNIWSSVTYPSNVIVFMGGVNDGGIGPSSPPQQQSMKNIATLLDAWRAAGKLVFLSNELPTGIALALREIYTVPMGGGAYDTVHSATYFSDDYVSYLGGANDGVKLASTTSSPSAGKYSVSNGSYTFSAADAGATVAIDYNYINKARRGVGHIALHNWLSSAAPDFVDPASHIDYHIPGALYKRSWVIPVDTWDAIADPSQSAKAYNRPYTLIDGLHPTLHGCRLIAKSFAAALQSRLPSTDYANIPKSDSEVLVVASGASSTFTSADTSPAAHAYAVTPVTPGSFTLTAGPVTGVDDGNGNITGTGIAAGSKLNYSSGAWTLHFSSAPANGAKIIGSTDPRELILNGSLSPVNGFNTVTSIFGCGASCIGSGNLTSSNNTGIPKSFTTIIDANTSAQLASGAMKINITLATTAVDGYPEMQVQLMGASNSSGGVNLALFQTAISTLSLNQKYRATALVRIDPGPNTELYGLRKVQIQVSCNAPAGTSFTPAGETATFSNGAGSPKYIGVAGTGSAFTNADVAGGELTLPLLSPSCDTTGMTGSPSGSIGFTIGTEPNVPISATIHISHLGMKPYSY